MLHTMTLLHYWFDYVQIECAIILMPNHTYVRPETHYCDLGTL